MAEFRIETDRLILRAWRAGDVDPLMQTLNTPAVTRWLDGPRARDHYVALHQRMAQGQARDGHCFWIVERKADAVLLGLCGLRRAGHAGTPVRGMMELGWRLGEAYWGQGYAKEAARAAIDWCRAHRPEDTRIIAYTVPDNQPSWGLMIGLGMVRRPELDFDHPAFPAGHILCRHIVYALDRTA